MKTLYIECSMGASGDMLQGALVDLLDCRDEFVLKMNSLGFDDIEVKCERNEKCGITGEKVSVLIAGLEESDHHIHGHDHHHGSKDHDHDHHHHHDSKYHNHNHHHEANHNHHGDDYEENHHDMNHHHCGDDYGEYGDHGNDHHEANHHHCGDDYEENHHEHGDFNHSNHSHSSLSYIEDIIDKLDVSDKVKKDSKAVFKIIAEAESKVHGKPVNDIHFHEVGSFDAICDIVGFGLLLEKLDVDKILVSPVNTGKGSVKCAHGILPVPAPATALILAGIPCYSNEVEGELCTPTGAALLKYYADEFTYRGLMTYEKIGYGLGTKDFEAANVVRMYLSEEKLKEKELTDTVVKFESNIDDMTAEDLAFAKSLLLSVGALEVFTTPVTMKKSRPGHVLTCLCREEDKDRILSIIFCHTSTIGVRETLERRYILKRRTDNIKSSFGDVTVKISEGYGVKKYKIEHDCLEKLADENKMSINDMRKKLEKELETKLII